MALIHNVVLHYFYGRILCMWSRQSKVLFFFLLASCTLPVSGCVTQTERIYPYESRDESVWEEIQRELSWQKGERSQDISQSTEPFYKRIMHGLITTTSGWFSEGDNRLSEREIAENRRHFNRKRAEALQRLREQQEFDEVE